MRFSVAIQGTDIHRFTFHHRVSLLDETGSPPVLADAEAAIEHYLAYVPNASCRA